MLRNNRVIYKDNTTLNDLSVAMSNYLSATSTLAIVAAQDAIYLGSDFPFNHRWFEVYSANAQASVPSISLWNGGSWVPAVDVIDETAVAGKTLAQSGIISWVPDRSNNGWTRQYSTEQISDLSSLRIYDAYWAKLSFSADLTATTALKYIGHKFSNDEELFAQYPDLEDANLINAFKTGKTNWNDQQFEAAQYIIEDLRSQSLIFSKNQIIDWRMLKNSSVHKVAEIIFRSFGDDYKDNKKDAADAYKASKPMASLNLDKNMNAAQDDFEKVKVTGWLTR